MYSEGVLIGFSTISEATLIKKKLTSLKGILDIKYPL